MSSINFATREISCKIVYYGPGLSGKTTNLQVIHQKIPREKKTEMVSLATEGDRTLFFDFLPLNLGDIKGFKTKFQLYTVPGQVYYNSTRKVVLRGVDGVVFVADSQRSRMAENLESLQNLRQNLQDYGLNVDDIPFVFQYNKRDMDNVFTLDELNAQLNPRNLTWYPATAHNGKGVVTTLKAISMIVIENFNLKQGILRRAAESAGNKGVHNVTFSGEKVNIAPVAPEPVQAQEGNKLFSHIGETSSTPMPDFDDAPTSESMFKLPGSFAPKASPSPVANSASAPAPVANSAPKSFNSSPFQAPKVAGPSEDSKPRVGSGISMSIPTSLKMAEEEIELRPYVPKSKDSR